MKRITCSIFAAAVLGGCGAPAPLPEAKEDSVGKKGDPLIVPFWWSGESSSCMTVEHDRTFWPQYWDAGREFGAVSGSNWEGGTGYGHPGCSAYIIDYQIPYDMVGAPWESAWIAGAPRVDLSTQWNSENTWVNMIVYLYSHHGAGSDGDVMHAESRKGNWHGSNHCEFEIPHHHWFTQNVHMVRVVTQVGTWAIPGGNHYSYFVTQ